MVVLLSASLLIQEPYDASDKKIEAVTGIRPWSDDQSKEKYCMGSDDNDNDET